MSRTNAWYGGAIVLMFVGIIAPAVRPGWPTMAAWLVCWVSAAAIVYTTERREDRRAITDLLAPASAGASRPARPAR
jgi:hypothetical protein